jgi:hypothetical protein
MINYKIISDSIDFYESKGFTRIESPWTVTEAISSITKPKDAREFKLQHEDGKVLVASGEQSFLYLFNKGFLPKGRYQTTTPCFRHEPFDSLHTKYFIKNELIDTKNVDTARLQDIVAIAFDFFSKYFDKKRLRIEGDGISGLSYDIQYKIPHTFPREEDTVVELGSYGIRTSPFVEWIYATGIAEPRTSSTLEMERLRMLDKARLDAI